MHSTTHHTGGLEPPRIDSESLDVPGGTSSGSVGVASPERSGCLLSGLTGGVGGLPLRDPPADGLSSLIHEHKSSASCPSRTYDDLGKESQPSGIDALPRRLERYAAAHSRALQMASYLRDLGELHRRADQLERCGSYLEFRRYFAPGDPVRLHAAMFCQQDKLCPFCAIRRGAKLLRRYTARLLHLHAAAPSLIPLMTTFTVKNGENLYERFQHLQRSYTRLMERRKHHLRQGQRWTEAARAWGAVGSIEVKRGTGSGKWHPHLHAVWLCDSMVIQDELSREWRAITGDSHQLDVRPFEFHRAGLTPTADLVASDFAEVFKYALKFSSMTLADNLTAFRTLFGRRLIRAHGVLHGIEAPDDLTDDPLDADDLPFVTLVFRFADGHYS